MSMLLGFVLFSISNRVTINGFLGWWSSDICFGITSNCQTAAVSYVDHDQISLLIWMLATVWWLLILNETHGRSFASILMNLLGTILLWFSCLTIVPTSLLFKSMTYFSTDFCHLLTDKAKKCEVWELVHAISFQIPHIFFKHCRPRLIS